MQSGNIQFPVILSSAFSHGRNGGYASPGGASPKDLEASRAKKVPERRRHNASKVWHVLGLAAILALACTAFVFLSRKKHPVAPLPAEAAKAFKAAKEATRKAKQHKEQGEILKRAAEVMREVAAKKATANFALQKADSLASHSKEEKQKAIDTENKALEEIAGERMCIGLPGVKLRGHGLATFDPVVVGEHPVADDVQCNDWCLKHTDCKQSVFTWETKTCELFTEATTEPLSFREAWPWFNSSYCDVVGRRQAMLDMRRKVLRKDKDEV